MIFKFKGVVHNAVQTSDSILFANGQSNCFTSAGYTKSSKVASIHFG